MADEQRFTLEEARQELARQDCLADGHDFDVVATFASDGAPAYVTCSRCARSWAVGSRDPAAAIEVVLSCEADGCEERLPVPWPRDGYTCLLSGEQLGGADGSLTLDGSAPVPRSASKWRVVTVRGGSEHRAERRDVRCPAHAAELE